MYCGKLFCSGGQSDPNYGRMVAFSGCKAAFFGDAAADYGQVDAGTKCGEGKVRPPTPTPPTPSAASCPVQCGILAPDWVHTIPRVCILNDRTLLTGWPAR